ncbi:hypothetical protein BB560_006975 [Smittium megazygosporum]|uniref:Chorismate mutase n=1 Tax=Smittium megazygosporum TaxID=133381 RepID=A0A2T9XZW1_9FUNG|nr:hypothetical protein BB560_006975 [Smittium megazygosporum]
MSVNLLSVESLSLEQLRNVLIRLEDSIIFAFAERAQFKTNETIYKPGAIHFKDGYEGSFFDWFLHEVESVHAKVRRYQSPDEYPFTKKLPEPVLVPLDYADIINKNDKVNINDQIKAVYLDIVVPSMCEAGDDSNYGSSATCDITCLQNLSRRIHYGKFVAESKFSDPVYHDKYVELIKAKDRDGLMQLLTNEKVEKLLLERLKRKAENYGQEFEGIGNISGGSQSPSVRTNPDLVVQIYKDYVIPLTKEVEVLYLLNRI